MPILQEVLELFFRCALIVFFVILITLNSYSLWQFLSGHTNPLTISGTLITFILLVLLAIIFSLQNSMKELREAEDVY